MLFKDLDVVQALQAVAASGDDAAVRVGQV